MSHGLETAVEDGTVRGLGDVEAYLEAVLRGQLAGQDLAALVAAWRAESAHAAAETDRALLARKLVRETREAARRAGRALLRAAPAVGADVRPYPRLVEDGEAAGLHPVVHGLVARAVGLDERAAALVYGHGFVLGGLSAATRLLPLDHLELQAALRRLHPAIEAAVERARDVADCPEEWGGFAPRAELFALRHERGTARAFAT